MTVVEQRARFQGWLRQRAGNVPIRFVETHVSIVGLTFDRVWKLKKAVCFPFVDLSTPDRRRVNAEREVALNRRFAPDVYLGVVPLVADGVVADWVVEMRRLPDARRLRVVAEVPGATDCIDRIADELARVHAAAPAGGAIDAAATPAAVQALWSRNLGELREFAPEMVDKGIVERIDSDARRYIDGRDALFASRIAQGRIRDGHGDLLADDVFCLDDGPRLLDGLEFDDRLRYGDVLGDVAFLAMDLERLGHRDLGVRLLAEYQRAGADSWPVSLADFYVAYRATVRAKVACLRADTDDARAHLALAAAHLAHGRVRLVLVGGPPASGKTTLARELGRRTTWPVLRSDELRKQLGARDPGPPAVGALDAGLYGAAWNARTYGALLDAAARHLELGESVILDASWRDPRWRDRARELGAATASEVSAFVLAVPEELAVARARARARTRAHPAHCDDASDATPEIAAALHVRFTPWPDAVALDATEPVADLAARVLARVGATS